MRVVRDGVASAATSGVPHAELLVRFSEALVAHDDAALAALRAPLIAALGGDGFLETAATAANFQRMVRIADGTGIPQEAPILTLGGDLIEELELRDFQSAGNTAASGLWMRIFGKLLRPIGPRLAAFVAGSLERRSR